MKNRRIEIIDMNSGQTPTTVATALRCIGHTYKSLYAYVQIENHPEGVIVTSTDFPSNWRGYKFQLQIWAK